MPRRSRQSPSGPRTTKRVRQIYTIAAPIPGHSQALLLPANPTAFLTGVSVGDTVTVTVNIPLPYGLIFTGTVGTGEPSGLVEVLASNFLSVPSLDTSFDLTVEVFFG